MKWLRFRTSFSVPRGGWNKICNKGTNFWRSSIEHVLILQNHFVPRAFWVFLKIAGCSTEFIRHFEKYPENLEVEVACRRFHRLVLSTPLFLGISTDRWLNIWIRMTTFSLQKRFLNNYIVFYFLQLQQKHLNS